MFVSVASWVTWSYLSRVAPCYLARWQSLRVCVHCVTVISHQSEAAEPHIDIPDCLPASLAKIDM